MALTDTLLSYYKLDEASGDALDAHGSTTLTETSGTIGATTGKILGARDFEAGDTEYFESAAGGPFSFGDESFAIQAWVFMESETGTIAGVWNDGTGQEWLLWYISDRFRFTVQGPTTETSVTANTFGALSTATWYHVVAWHDATANEIGIAVNLTADTAAHSDGCSAAGTRAFQLGNYTSGYHWDGLIDEFAIWNRVLTSDERTELYGAGSGLAYPFAAGGHPAVKRMGGVPFAYRIGGANSHRAVNVW